MQVNVELGALLDLREGGANGGFDHPGGDWQVGDELSGDFEGEVDQGGLGLADHLETASRSEARTPFWSSSNSVAGAAVVR